MTLNFIGRLLDVPRSPSSVDDVVAARPQAVAEGAPELRLGRGGLLDPATEAARPAAHQGTAAGIAERGPDGRAAGGAHGSAPQRAPRCRAGGRTRGLRRQLAALPHVPGEVLGARAAVG